MTAKQMAIFITLVVSASAALEAQSLSQISTVKSSTVTAAIGQPLGSSVNPLLLSDAIFYRHILRQAAAFGHEADRLVNKGLPAGVYGSFFTNDLGLTEEQSQLLKQVAFDYEVEWRAYRIRVHQHGEEFRDKYIRSGLFLTVNPPRPDPAMLLLQKEGDGITLRAHDRLLSSFGQDSFRQADLRMRTRLSTAFTHK